MVDEFAVDGVKRVRRAFGRAAPARLRDPDSAKIPQILSDRLIERLSSLAIDPAVVLDVGSPLPVRQQQLAQSFPAARSLVATWHEQQPDNVDSTPTTVNRLAGAITTLLPEKLQKVLPGRQSMSEFSSDPCSLPLPDASVDLVVACQVLPWCADPGALFREMHRVLRPGGAFFWSSAGPDTLHEYRLLWAEIDPYPHVFGLHDMHDLGDDMLRSGFDSPVMDRENLTISYESMENLVADMRAAGAFGLATGRRRGLMASSISSRLHELCSGGLDVTIEHVQGHGWKSNKPPSGEFDPENGEITIPVSAIGRIASR